MIGGTDVPEAAADAIRDELDDLGRIDRIRVTVALLLARFALWLQPLDATDVMKLGESVARKKAKDRVKDGLDIADGVDMGDVDHVLPTNFLGDGLTATADPGGATEPIDVEPPTDTCPGTERSAVERHMDACDPPETDDDDA